MPKMYGGSDVVSEAESCGCRTEFCFAVGSVGLREVRHHVPQARDTPWVA